MSLPTMTAPPTAPTVSDDSQTFNMRAFALVAWFATHVAEQSLWAAALPSAITGTDFSATSTTSLTVGAGSKSLTIQTGKQFQIGQPVRIAYTTTPSDYMDGQVTAYNSGTGAMTVNVTATGGSGTQSAWTVSLLPGSGSDFVTLTGTQTLTDKTLQTPVIGGGVSGVAAGKLGYSGGLLTYGDGANQWTIASTDQAQTLSNKTIDFGVGGNVGKVNGNTFAATAGTATITFFNSSDTVVGRATTDTLTNKTLDAPTINNATISSGTINASNAVSDTGTIAAASPGFRGLPASSQSPGSGITLALADAGKQVPNSSGGWTIPANASVAFPIGSSIVLYNNSSSSQTVAITSDTLRLAGTASTGSRTLAQRGLATIVKVAAAEWVISGAGVS